MKINDLVIYIKVYETNSMNKAAQSLGYAQSNISQRIQFLENYFNQTFFIRGRSGINPTKNGDIFYEYSKTIINETDKLNNMFVSRKKSILCSELLFNVMYKKKSLNELSEANIKLVNSSYINIESTRNNYDEILTFNKLNTKYYKLTTISSMNVGMYKSNMVQDDTELPLLVNTDIKCPLREISLNLKTIPQIVELDSLDAIINIVKNGEGMALLPKESVLDLPLVNTLKQIKAVPFYKYNHLSNM
ncbi:LysR family transcriptional regulator [Staphylococcus gallinarum]|uniref:LysR family transcriptional regulator n=1 Tax=Staphylococcus gallinarum TaxID=1293 RepID=A0A3A0W0J3_STAGA|nr:LysR family transcriptional regulator [Staphylococcus gallinarum]RIP33418.1 LysR family transcriptional regulator [Staphylococcus gallinarum]